MTENNKKYFYMRLRENFFDSDEMRILENLPDGYLYSNILLKMYLRSLKGEGRLMFNDLIPYNAQMLATLTGHKIGVVEKALEIFQQLGIVEILDNGTIYMLNIQNFIGKSSTEADRKREYDRRISEEKRFSCGNVGDLPEKCTEKSPRKVREISEKCTTELDIEKDIDIENKDIVRQNPTAPPHKEIIDYLNEKTHSHYKHTTKATQRIINGRISEGFTVEDFKKVIDTKADQWLNDKKMSAYLRPETLFAASHFESYLNEVREVTKESKYPGVSEKLAKETEKNIGAADDYDYGDFQ